MLRLILEYVQFSGTVLYSNVWLKNDSDVLTKENMMSKINHASVVEPDEFISLVHSSPNLTILQIEEVTGVSLGTIWNRVHHAGNSSRRDFWLPHNLTYEQLVCLQFIASYEL